MSLNVAYETRCVMGRRSIFLDTSCTQYGSVWIAVNRREIPPERRGTFRMEREGQCCVGMERDADRVSCKNIKG